MPIKIALLTIGNELLEGRILDRNASFFCQTLYSKGYLVQEKRSILDHPKTILKTLEELLESHDFVITSGGLGPTLDDLTLSVVCDLFKSKLSFDSTLFKKLVKKFPFLKPEFLEYAANIPQKGEVFKNHAGIIPGYLFKKGAKRLILLPGVPHEFQHLIQKEILPLIQEKAPLKSREYKEIIHLCRVPESEIASTLEELKAKNPKLDFGIYPHLGILSIHVKVKASSLTEAKKHSTPVIKHVKKRYPTQFFSGRFSSIQEALQAYFIKQKWTLSCAESCSGGAIASSFTHIPGASNYFKSSLVAYENSIKEKLLGVSKTVLKQDGAVSEACVKQMAIGCNSLFKTDFAIATSGIAGPKGGSKEKPVGTVWIALAKGKKILFCQKFLFKGSRSFVIERTRLYSLAQLWMIRDNASSF